MAETSYVAVRCVPGDRASGDRRRSSGFGSARSRTQATSAPGPTGAQYGPAPSGRGSGPKAVLTGPLTVIGLKRTLHERTLPQAGGGTEQRSLRGEHPGSARSWKDQWRAKGWTTPRLPQPRRHGLHGATGLDTASTANSSNFEAYRPLGMTTTFSTARGGRHHSVVLASICPEKHSCSCCGRSSIPSWRHSLDGAVEKPVGFGEKPLVEASC